MAAPALSPAGQGRIYFSSADNKFKVSQNGGAYVDLLGTGGVSGTGTTNFIPKWSSATGLTDSVIQESPGGILINGMTVGNGPNADSPSVAVGNGALFAVSTGYANVAVGGNAFSSLTTQYENVGVGTGAGADTLGNFNTAIGTYALGDAAGSTNTAIGARALSVTGGHTGGSNTVVGAWSATNLTSGSGNIIIGASIDAPSATGDYQLNIGNLMYGDMTTGANKNLDLDGAFNLRGRAAPSVSAAGQGRIYFSSADNKFKVSQNGGAYVDLVGGGTGDIANGGNTFGAAATIGTNDNFALNLETNGSPRMTILNSGYVGVGITNPTFPLDVRANSTAAPFSQLNLLNTGTGTESYTQMSYTATGRTYTTGVGNASETSGLANSFFIYDSTGDEVRMVINEDGAVGIGTTAPGALFQLGTAGTSLGTMRLTGNTSGYVQIQPAAAAGSWTMTLPVNDGDNGQALITNGSGVTSWSTVPTNGGTFLAADGTNAAPGFAFASDTNTGIYSPYADAISISAGGSGVITIDSGGLAVGSSAWIRPSASNLYPSYTFGGDEDTGIYRAAADTIQFTTAGTDRMTIGSTGNVGIGATAPGAMLQLGTAGTSLGTMRLTGNTSGYVQIQPAAAAGSWTMTLPVNDGDNGQVLTTNGSGVTSWTAAGGGSSTLDGLTDVAANYTSYNMFLGSGVGASTSGTRNTGLGGLALQSLTTGNDNVAVGAESLNFNTTGSDNIAVGREALIVNVSGNANVAVGKIALMSNTTGNNSTAIGNGALGFADATENTAVGGGALGGGLTTGGDNNVALGGHAGRRITGASGGNIFIGYLAGPDSNTTLSNTLWIHNYEGSNPTIFGDMANLRIGLGGIINPSTTLDVLGAVTQRGMAAPAVSPAGQGRIYFDSTSNKFRVSQHGGAYTDLVSAGGGGVTFPTDSTAGASIAIGTGALASQTSSAAYNNIALGYNALGSAGITTAARNNIAIGRNVLDSVTSGYQNIGIGGDDDYGKFPLTAVTTGDANVAMGAGAGGGVTTGSYNTAIGHWSMLNVSTTGGNTYVGSSSGLYSVGENDTAVGINALYDSQAGYNAAFGASALQYVNTGSNNVGMGFVAGGNLTTGSQNTLLGAGAGNAIVSGSNNVVIGYDVGATTLASGSGNILIGTSIAVDAPAAGTNNHLNIGNTIYGSMSTAYVGFGTATLTHPLQVASGAHVTGAGVWTNASDRRIKMNIVDSHYGLNELLQLRPVDYVMKKSGEKQVGFIAQEVQQVVPEVVSGFEGDTEKGEILGISYGNLVPILVNAIKELFVKSEVQARSIASKADESRVEALEIENEKLKQENSAIKAYLCSKDPEATICN